jgi:hypothetical protein
VTFKWSSGCEATEAITYSKGITYVEDDDRDELVFIVTFPTGDQSALELTRLNLVVANQTDGNDITTLYYAALGTFNDTVNLDEARTAPSIIIDVDTKVWISRVACTPTLEWEVSSFIWRNSSMTEYQPAPSSNTTVLDTEGLGLLSDYMSAVLLQAMPFAALDMQILSTALMFDSKSSGVFKYQAPLLSDFDGMYGLVAESIVSVITSGYYGVAEVPTVGSEPKPAYFVSTYILAIVVAILVLVPASTEDILLWNRWKRVPIRRASLLTVANATHGAWWDEILHGGCVMSASQLRKEHSGLKVMYGVDVNMPGHVGFAEESNAYTEEGNIRRPHVTG